MAVSPIPPGYHSVTPYLKLKRAAEAIEFYKKAFGATEIMRFPMPDGRVGHAQLKIGDSNIMLADEFPEMGYLGPESRGGTTVTMALYVEQVDAVVERAVAAGARLVRQVKLQFYGDRSGVIVDPFGHEWTIATRVEEVSMEEMQRRVAQPSGF